MCTSLLAGRKATAGRVILARNEDFTRNNWNKYLTYRQLPQYLVPDTPSVTDGVWTLGNGLAVPRPRTGRSYSAMPDAAGATEASHGIGDFFFFEARGVNSANVAISATNSMTTNDQAKTADPFRSPGIEESIIPTLVLPQADSARHGVELLGGYVERYGASEPNGILIGDPYECWYLEIGSGHHWIAVRVPAELYVAVANDMRIHGVDLTSDGVRHSKGLVEFTRRQGLLDHLDPHAFNFAKAFGVLGNPYNVDRIWLAQRTLTPSQHQAPRLEQYPLFQRPDNPIQAADVMAVMRATYANTELANDPDAVRPIGIERTTESHIITLDADMPAELAGLVWQAVSTPLGAPYLPLYSVMTDVPASYTRGANEFTPWSAYWAFHGAHALRRLIRHIDHIEHPNWWLDFERLCLAEAPLFRSALVNAYQMDRMAAVDMAKRHSTGVAAQAVDLAGRATGDIITALAAEHACAHARAVSTSVATVH